MAQSVAGTCRKFQTLYDRVVKPHVHYKEPLVISSYQELFAWYHMHHPPPLPMSHGELLAAYDKLGHSITGFQDFVAVGPHRNRVVFICSAQTIPWPLFHHWTSTASHEFCTECSSAFDKTEPAEDKTVTVRIQISSKLSITVWLKKGSLLWGCAPNRFRENRMSTTFMFLQDLIDDYTIEVYKAKSGRTLSLYQAAALAGKQRLQTFKAREEEDLNELHSSAQALDSRSP